MNGKQISIRNENAAFIASCARELENDELLGRIKGFHLDGDGSILNLVGRIRINSGCHSDYKSERDFVASHSSWSFCVVYTHNYIVVVFFKDVPCR